MVLQSPPEQSAASVDDIERYEVIDSARVARELMGAFETVLASWLCHLISILQRTDTLDGGEMLSGFRLSMARLYEAVTKPAWALRIHPLPGGEGMYCQRVVQLSMGRSTHEGFEWSIAAKRQGPHTEGPFCLEALAKRLVQLNLHDLEPSSMAPFTLWFRRASLEPR
jgi:hypothetical protein